MALTLTCPVCGKRNGYEFRYGGEDKGPKPDDFPGNVVRLCPHEPLRCRHSKRVVVPPGWLRRVVHHPSGHTEKPGNGIKSCSTIL